MGHQNINVRLEVATLRQIDEACAAETRRTGYTINRSSFVRRALEKALQEGKAEKLAKAAAMKVGK